MRAQEQQQRALRPGPPQRGGGGVRGFVQPGHRRGCGHEGQVGADRGEESLQRTAARGRLLAKNALALFEGGAARDGDAADPREVHGHDHGHGQAGQPARA